MTYFFVIRAVVALHTTVAMSMISLNDLIPNKSCSLQRVCGTREYISSNNSGPSSSSVPVEPFRSPTMSICDPSRSSQISQSTLFIDVNEESPPVQGVLRSASACPIWPKIPDEVSVPCFSDEFIQFWISSQQNANLSPVRLHLLKKSIYRCPENPKGSEFDFNVFIELILNSMIGIKNIGIFSLNTVQYQYIEFYVRLCEEIMKCLAPNIEYCGEKSTIDEIFSKYEMIELPKPQSQEEQLLLHSHIPRFSSPFSEFSNIGINITLSSIWNGQYLTYTLSVENCSVSKTILSSSPWTVQSNELEPIVPELFKPWRRKIILEKDRNVVIVAYPVRGCGLPNSFSIDKHVEHLRCSDTSPPTCSQINSTLVPPPTHFCLEFNFCSSTSPPPDR